MTTEVEVIPEYEWKIYLKEFLKENRNELIEIQKKYHKKIENQIIILYHD